MSVYRIYPSKDTFITNFRKNSAYQTGSNLGKSQVLRLFRVAPVSGSTISGSSARVLMKFDLGYISTLTGSRNCQSKQYGILFKT